MPHLNGNTRETHGSLNSRDAISVKRKKKKRRERTCYLRCKARLAITLIIFALARKGVIIYNYIDRVKRRVCKCVHGGECQCREYELQEFSNGSTRNRVE